MKSSIKVKKIAYDVVRLTYTINEPNLCLQPSHRRYGRPDTVGSLIPLSRQEEYQVYCRIKSYISVVNLIEDMLGCSIDEEDCFYLKNYLVEEGIKVTMSNQCWRVLEGRNGGKGEEG